MLYEHSAIRPHPPSLSVGAEGTTQNLPADSLQVREMRSVSIPVKASPGCAGKSVDHQD